MKVVKDMGTVVPVVLLTAAAVLSVAIAMSCPT